MTIELRLTDVDPPAAEPKRTIYRDIANLPDPTTLGVTIRYFNYDDVGLYMQITGSATGYTFTPVNLGLLATGANAYKNLDNFASRAKPTVAQLPNGEMGENITLTLKAYTDSGYTDLKWTFDRVVQVIWINSADAAFTVDELDNFDDGTVQGWAVTIDAGGGGQAPTLTVVNDYVLSTPYSIKMLNPTGPSSQTSEQAGRLYKSFTTPNKDTVYAIIDVRISIPYVAYVGPSYSKYIRVNRDGTVLVFLGRPYDAVEANYAPLNKWMRIVVPLPKNVTTELRIIFGMVYIANAYGAWRGYLWLDDFKMISK